MVATRIVNLKLHLDQREEPSFPGQQDECKNCKQNAAMAQGADPNSPHIFATVRKSQHGSPTRIKGKRDNYVGAAASTSALEMIKPANL